MSPLQGGTAPLGIGLFLRSGDTYSVAIYSLIVYTVPTVPTYILYNYIIYLYSTHREHTHHAHCSERFLCECSGVFYEGQWGHF